MCRDRRVVERARVDNGRSFVLKMNANGISCSCSPLISDDQIAGPSSTPAKASDGTRIAFVEAAAARPRTDEEQDSPCRAGEPLGERAYKEGDRSANKRSEPSFLKTLIVSFRGGGTVRNARISQNFKSGR